MEISSVEAASRKPVSYVGIDPGAKGAVVVVESGVRRWNMFPKDQALLASVLRDIPRHATIFIEKVWGMPGQNSSAVFTFGERFGFIQGVLTSMGERFNLVAPATWRSTFGIRSGKQGVEALAKELFPDFYECVKANTITKDKAAIGGVFDALFIAEYGRRLLGDAGKSKYEREDSDYEGG